MCERDLAANDRAARHNREQFHDYRVVAVHLMGSSASGKTTLLEATARALTYDMGVGVLAAELATNLDAKRLQAAGALAETVQTGHACHLDAEMVHRSLRALPWRDLDYLFMEDVGNLVCPAVYDLGQDVNVVALSATEGPEKPLKYPTVFQKADLVLLTKIDLLPTLGDVDLEAFRTSLAAVMPHPSMLPVSGRTGAGIGDWIRWLHAAGRRRGARCALGAVGI